MALKWNKYRRDLMTYNKYTIMLFSTHILSHRLLLSHRKDDYDYLEPIREPI
jgi:hypothetical protein